MSNLPDRVTKSRIDELMSSLQYQAQIVPDTTTTIVSAKFPDGFVVETGSAACISRENFNEKVGFDLALKDARERAEKKLWELEGYVLRMKKKKELEQTIDETVPVMNFGEALDSLKTGIRVSRRGWNGKGMYLAMQKPDDDSKMTLPYIYMKTACGNKVPWLASQTDLLSEDWFVVLRKDP